MKRKDYEEPTTKVVQLQQRSHILNLSDPQPLPPQQAQGELFIWDN